MPTSSYVEMGEWALPPDESLAFTAALHAAQRAHKPEARWLRGAFWRNFQVRYREINDLHKQMLRTSAKVDELPDGDDRVRALDHLYQGQSNDCYWHGLFGGIYISHMRLATYEHLIAAEDIADRALGRDHVTERLDLDLDGHDDVRLAGPGQVVTVDLNEGAGIGGWDVRAVRHALGAVMRRRPEAYHETLRRHEAAGPESAKRGDAPESIHEVVRTKEPGLSERLHYDPFERRSGLVRFLPPDSTAEAWATAAAVELGDAVEGAFEIVSIDDDRLVVTRGATVAGEFGPVACQVTKDLSIGGDRRSPTLGLAVTVENRSNARLDALLGIEWTLTMLGGGGNPSAWLEVDDARASHDSHGTATDVRTFSQGNDWIGVSVETTVSEPAGLWWSPVETVSNSEAGFERIYQGAGLLLAWPLSLAGGASRTLTVEQAVMTTRDRDEEEAAAGSGKEAAAGTAAAGRRAPRGEVPTGAVVAGKPAGGPGEP